MKLRTRWPWVTALLAAAAVLNPLGLDIFYSGFLSDEQLSLNIWAPIAWVGILLLTLIVLLEWAVRTRIFKRDARSTTTI